MVTFFVYPDGHIYPEREMLEALEGIVQNGNHVALFCFNISNGLQV